MHQLHFGFIPQNLPYFWLIINLTLQLCIGLVYFCGFPISLLRHSTAQNVEKVLKKMGHLDHIVSQILMTHSILFLGHTIVARAASPIFMAGIGNYYSL